MHLQKLFFSVFDVDSLEICPHLELRRVWNFYVYTALTYLMFLCFNAYA